MCHPEKVREEILSPAVVLRGLWLSEAPPGNSKSHSRDREQPLQAQALEDIPC